MRTKFDELLDIVLHQKKLSAYLPVFKAARLFHFDLSLDLSLTTIPDRPNAMALNARLPDIEADTLKLPFDVTALVFKDACTIFCDLDKSSGYYQFISLNTVDEKMHILIYGRINISDKTGGIAGLYGLMTKTNKWGKVDFPQSETGALLPLLYKQFNSLQELNTLDRFVLEIAKLGDKFSKKYIPKSHQRPRYILLKPHEIRRYMKTEHEAMDKKKCAHERRAHYRTYPDDATRFPNAHGKRIRIEAVWIGSTSAVIGTTQYRVML